MTESSSEDEDTKKDHRLQMIKAQKRLNEYRFKKSFLYQMCWSDLNDHYTIKSLYFIGYSLRRIIYAYSLTNLIGDYCLQIKYLIILNGAVINIVDHMFQSLAYTLGFRPFKCKYLSYCAGIDELLIGVASSCYYAFYHRTSTRSAEEGLGKDIKSIIIIQQCV